MTTESSPQPGRDADSLPLTSIPGLIVAGALLLLTWLVFREVGVLALLLAALVVLWPLRRESHPRRLLILFLLLGTLWILHKSRAVVYPLLAGLLIAYWCDPIVTRLQKRRIPRSIGALVTIVPALTIAALFVFFIAPVLFLQLGRLLSALPGVIELIETKIRPFLSHVIPVPADPGPGSWVAGLSTHIEPLLRGVWGGAAGIGRGVGAVMAFFGMLILAPVLSYYVLVDLDRLRAWMGRMVPDGQKARAEKYGRIFGRTLSAYFRGQVLVSASVGGLLTLGYVAIGLPYALLLGFLAGLLNLIPILGFWTATTLAVLAGILSGEPGVLLPRLAIVLVIELAIESQVLTPRIVGGAVGLNPAMTLLSVLVFGAVLGPLGVLIAVPSAAIALLLWQEHRAEGAATPDSPDMLRKS